jgi:hypothetical protein
MSSSEATLRKGHENPDVYDTPTKGAPGSASGRSSNGCDSNSKKYGKLNGRYRGGGGRSKRANSVSSAASGSDAGSHAQEDPQPYSDKKKRNNRRRRHNPKLRNKVDSSPHQSCSSSKGGLENEDSYNPYPKQSRKYAFGWNTTACPASKGRPTSKKKHDAPMTKRDLYFSLYCERVAIGGKHGEITESLEQSEAPLEAAKSSDAVARVTMINWESEIILDTFVVVPVPVTNFYDTGITAHDVAADSPNAKSFAEVRRTVESRLKGKILIGHDVQYHLSSLGLSHPPTDTRDCCGFFSEYGMQQEGKEEANKEDGSLDVICKQRLQRSLPPSGHSERPMQSCLAALDLYKKYRKEWEEFLISESRKKQKQLDQRAGNADRHPRTIPQARYSPPHAYPMHPRARLGSADTINSVQSMQSLHSVRSDVVALNCETVQTSSNTLAIARVTVMNALYEVMWDVFVEAYMPVIPSSESSIVPEDLIHANGAVPLSQVKSTIEQMLHGKIVVGYKIDVALQALGIRFPPSQLRDTAYFRPFMYAEMDGVSGAPVVVERSLDELSLEVLQKPLVLPCNRNRSLAACSAVLGLYQMYQDRWEQEAFVLQQQGPGYNSLPYRNSNQLVPQVDASQNKSSSSWFSWGKKLQSDGHPQFHPQERFQPLMGAAANLQSSTALSERAFEALHGGAVSPCPSYGYRDGSSYYESSSQIGRSTLFDGSSHYERSMHATFDDSTSRGIIETFTAPSVVSSQHDKASMSGSEDASGQAGQSSSYQKSSSWFRFGSKKIRAASPSSRVSMAAVHEQPSVVLADAARLDSSAITDSVLDLNASEDSNTDSYQNSDQPSSRSWFSFRRRSLSPSRLAGRASSPLYDSPQSGPTAATSGSDDVFDPSDGSRLVSSMDAIEVSLAAVTEDKQLVSPLKEMTEAYTLSERSGTSSWFNFLRPKSPKPPSDAADETREDLLRMERISDHASDQGDSMAATGKTNGTDDDWLHEVMSQSTGTGDDVNSMGFASLLDADASIGEAKPEKSKKSRGSSWFGFKRSKSSKASKLEPVSDDPEGSANLKLPGLVSVDISQSTDDAWSQVASGNPYTSSPPPLGVSWYLGVNDNVTHRRSSSNEEPALARSRLPTESTVPTVSTEEAEEDTDNSGKDFAEEFEKGVAQSFAYLEI